LIVRLTCFICHLMYLMCVLYYIKLMLAFKNMFVLFRYGSQWFAIVPTVTILINNKELFVTKENPKLGLTNLVEHQIHLKPDAISKHQRPYKNANSLKDLQEFFDDCIQLDWSYRHRNVSLHKGIAFFRTRNIKRKDKTTRLRAIF
jgi:hypothetical protein